MAEEDDDIHSGRRHLRSVKARIAALKGGKRVVEFLEHLEARGLDPLMIVKCPLPQRLEGLDLDQASRKDFERFIAGINSEQWSPFTKRTYKPTVKKFFRYPRTGKT